MSTHNVRKQAWLSCPLFLKFFPKAMRFSPILNKYPQLMLPSNLSISQKLHVFVSHLLYQGYGHITIAADPL